MPSVTAAPWNLPYPDASDSPADSYAVLQGLAERMDFHYTNWWATYTRLRRRGAAKVSYDSTVRYKINGTAQNLVTYNSVQCDTAGMTDLQRRPDRIYLPPSPRPALYMVGGSVVGLSVTQPSVPDIRLTSNAQWSAAPLTPAYFPFTSRDMNQDRGDTIRGETFSISTQILSYQAADTRGFDDELWIAMEINSGIDFTVWYADMWAFWTSDVGTIPPT